MTEKFGSRLQFQHYKNGKQYTHIWDAKWIGSENRPNREFVFDAKHTETGQTLKVYRNEYGTYEYLHDQDLGELTVYRGDYYDPTYGYNMIWVRPADMFWGDVEIEEGEFVPRFRLLPSEVNKR